jgi:hypothetical protein
VSSNYSDLDRLVLERWMDVKNLAEAQRDVQDRIEQVVEIAGERIGRWLREQGYESECEADGGEIAAWRPAWADRRRGAMVSLLLGGFCPSGFRKTDESHPYLWVYTGGLEEFRVKEPARIALAADLRRELGTEAAHWEDHDTDDTDTPLGRYLKEFGAREQCEFVSSPEALLSFAMEQYPKIFALSDAIDACLARLPR